MSRNALVMLSGGLESTALIPHILKNGSYDVVEALHVCYGQTNSKEKEAAGRIANYYGIEITFIDLSEVFSISGCAMIAKNNSDVSATSQCPESGERNFGVAEKTFVPYRNGVFISVAAAMAYSKECGSVFYGVHALNTAQEKAYPDCSKKFISAQIEAIKYGTEGHVELVIPFKSMEKYQVLKFGLDECVPYELTWSCYTNNEFPCGKCFACIEREKAFASNNAKDPLLEKIRK